MAEIILNDLKNTDLEDIYLTDMVNLPFLKGEKGEQGIPGEQGIQGKSAYQVALDNGFVGTEEEWLESLKSKEALNVEIEKDGFGNYTANYNDNDINNARNSGKVVQAKYYDNATNQTYTYYYSTMESDRKPTFIRTYNEGNKVIQVLASVSYDKKVTIKRNIVDVDKLIEPVNNEVDQLTGEVSDIKEQQGLFKTEQTLQNKAIQKNVDDIIATNKSIEEKYNKLKSNLINLSAEGEEIQVNDSSDLEAKIDVKGNTKQETTEGKQLYNVNNPLENYVNNTEILKDDWIKMSYDNTNGGSTIYGLYTTKYMDYIKPNTNYALIVEIKEMKGDMSFQFNSGNESMIQFTQTPYLNQSETSLGFHKYIIKSSNNVTSMGIRTVVPFYPKHKSSIIFRMSLVENTDISEKDFKYESYTGGQASPNPDYPQEIESVKAYNLYNKATEIDNTYIDDKTGEAKSSGYYFASDYIEIKSNIKMLLTWESENLFNKIYYAFYDSNKKYVSGANSGSLNALKYEIIVPKNVNYIRISMVKNVSEVIVERKNIQLIEGTEQKPYSPYGEIAVKQTGKNLFDKNSITKKLFYIADGNFLYANNNWDLSNYIEAKANENFVFNPHSSIGLPYQANYSYYDINKNLLGGVGQANNLYTDYKIKVADNPNIAYIRIGYRNNISIDKAQVEKGTKSTEFESYKQPTIYPIKLGNTELNGNTELRDTPYKENGKWYFDIKWDKYIFTGEETSIIENSALKGLFQITLSNVLFDNTKVICFSNYLIGETGGKITSSSKDNLIATSSNNRLFMKINKYANNIAGFKKWLKDKKTEGNPMYAIYPLATPTKTEITDPVLISQLDNLENAKLFQPTTILTNNSIAIMKLDYIADTKAYIDNLVKPQIAEMQKAIVASKGGN